MSISSRLPYTSTLLHSAFVQVAHQTVVTYFFISIVFVTAVGVIAFHFHSFCITKSAVWLNLHKAVIGRFKSPKVTAESDPPPATVSASSHVTVSRTVIELREPLLDDNMH